VELLEIALLIGAGLLAGVVNTLAGGGSLLTIPLLVLIGLPGNVANGTNRLGILVQSAMAVWSFRAQGVSEFRSAVPVLVPLALGSLTGACLIARVSDASFEKAFGIVMLLLLVPTFARHSDEPSAAAARAWSPVSSGAVFFAIGAYGGSFQAGVGILLLLALSRAGFDLVRANAVKVLVVAAITLVALPVFVAGGQVAWLPAVLLAAGFSGGGALGARLAVRAGERLIRPVAMVAVIALAARMLGLV
jgi:uncharacterized membrane protein YfcA